MNREKVWLNYLRPIPGRLCSSSANRHPKRRYDWAEGLAHAGRSSQLYVTFFLATLSL